MDRAEELTANLTHLDAALEAGGLSGTELASLLRERRITVEALAALQGVERGSSIDELAKRRQDRRSAAKVDDTAQRGGEQRGKRSG